MDLIEQYVQKIDRLTYIWFSFYKKDNQYQCIIYTNDDVYTPSGNVENQIYNKFLYIKSSFRLTKVEALSELIDELDFLYNEYSDFTERARLEEDKSVFSKYISSPYHAALLSKQQYLYLLDKYYHPIMNIFNMTEEFKNTSNIKIIRKRLKYAKEMTISQDFSNIFFLRNFECLSTNDFANLLIGMTQPYITLDRLIQDCNDKFFNLDLSGYINQWILRSYESTLTLPKRWPIDNRKRIYPSMRDYTYMVKIDNKDIVVLTTNVNKEI